MLGGCAQSGTPEAQARAVISAGEQAAGATVFEPAADVNEIVLELQLEDDEWKVVRAAWQATRRG